MVMGALAGVLLLIPLTATPATATRETHPDAELLRSLLEAEHTAGMPGVFAEVRSGRATWRGAAGVANVTTGAPTRPYMRHRIGSITKTFVATTVLQLVGERRIKLDAPIGRYLPDLVPGEVGRTVTVRMLLNHTSGIGNYTDTLFATLDGLIEVGRTSYTPRQLVEIGLAMPPTNAPGAAWSYSNTNYILAGLLVERVTGRPMEAEVSRRILRPLGLWHTYFPGDEPYIRGPHASAYVPWIDGNLRDFEAYQMSWGWAAGEMVSTMDDLNRFFRALSSGRLLGPALLAEMRETVPVDPSLPEAGGYGLGLFNVTLPCGVFWGHTGGVIGQSTFSFHSADGSRQVSMAENMAF
jgi:D-alanyl-D-alanine carboxypeptidase